jgi:5-methylcytosine-specific restriction endonuclease McrA
VGRPRSWTDEQLRTAVVASTSMKDVVDRLRQVAGAASFRAARVRVEVLDLDTSHFGPGTTEVPSAGEQPHQRRRWTEDDLRQAVAAAGSLHGVFAELGLVPGGSQWLAVRQMIGDLRLDTSHWARPLGKNGHATPHTWSDEDLRRIVPACRSYAEVMRRLGVRPSGSAHAAVRDRIAGLGLDTSHMSGQGWARGRTNPSRRARRPLSEILVAGRPASDTSRLRERLIQEQVKEHRCEGCGGAQWRDGPIPLELDHINGDRRDNRLENLRVLCPNCHAQTPTYRGRNRGRYDRPAPGEA